MKFCKKLCKKWIFFQNNSVENSLICPNNKSASHTANFFPIKHAGLPRVTGGTPQYAHK